MKLESSTANRALDLLSTLPYFKGKGSLALAVMRAFPRQQFTARLPFGGRMRIGLDPMRQSVLPYWIGKYEPNVVHQFCEMLGRVEPDAAVVDIGANMGFYTVLAGAALASRGNATVHSFEPNPRIFAELEQNIALNQFKNVQAHCEGVGDVVSEMTLYVNEHAITYSSLRRTQDFLGDEIRVPVTTLDEYARARQLKKIGLVKIDVEGAELLVLRGARENLLRDHPILFYEEFERGYQQFGYSTQDVRTFLAECGYELFEMQEEGHRAPRKISVSNANATGYQNVLALPTK